MARHTDIVSDINLIGVWPPQQPHAPTGQPFRPLVSGAFGGFHLLPTGFHLFQRKFRQGLALQL